MSSVGVNSMVLPPIGVTDIANDPTANRPDCAVLGALVPICVIAEILYSYCTPCASPPSTTVVAVDAVFAIAVVQPAPSTFLSILYPCKVPQSGNIL